MSFLAGSHFFLSIKSKVFLKSIEAQTCAGASS